MNGPAVDLSVFNRFSFTNRPVGVKFLFSRPEGIDKLDGKLALCEMLKKAQQSEGAFYADIDNHDCEAATYLFGYDIPEEFKAGLFGAELGIFEEPRANQKVYMHVPRLEKGITNYVVFAPINQMSFDPDVFIIFTDDVSQTEIILRAMSYTTGIPYTSKMTNVLGCSYLFLHSYLTGEVNYITTGLGFGMKQRKVFPAGKQIIAIPYNWLPTIVRSLEKMTWLLPAYTDEGDEAIKQASIKLGLSTDQAG
jgi:uncharacterized protein (DUF169 family)